MRRLRLLAPLLFLALASPAEAVDVHVGAGGFSPLNVSIQTGDTVRWCWDDPVHTVTSTGGPDQYDTDPNYPPTPPNHPGCTFSHQFNTAGTSTYKDKVTPATAQVTIAARPPGNQPPVAGFTISPNPANTGQTVTFNASASSDPDGSIVRYEWDLDGDGSFEVSGTSPTTTRTYSAAGTFAVTLKVTDSNQPPSFGSASSAITVQGTAGGGGGNKLPGSPPSADDTAPVAAVALNRRSRGRGALRGVRAAVSCSEACTVQLALVGQIGHAPQVVLGTSQFQIAKAGRAQVRVPILNKAAARRFARNPNAKLFLKTRVIDKAGNYRDLLTDLTAPGVPRGPLAQLGLSDQNPETFTDPLFSLLGLHYARLVIPWDAILRSPEPLDNWIKAVRQAGVQPLISFEHSASDRCPGSPCSAPSTPQYTAAFKAFRAKYGFIRDYSPWNEANHKTQPTYRHPEVAAVYYGIVKANCAGCHIVAADVLDEPNMTKWITKFRRAGGANARLWGLHNYRDTNRFRSIGTQTLLKLVKGQVWLTETGGIVRFTTAKGVAALPADEKRAARSMRFLFRLVRDHAKRIKRVYIYNWRSDPTNRFDAGLIGPDGKPRLTYDIVRDAVGQGR